MTTATATGISRPTAPTPRAACCSRTACAPIRSRRCAAMPTRCCASRTIPPTPPTGESRSWSRTTTIKCRPYRLKRCSTALRRCPRRPRSRRSLRTKPVRGTRRQPRLRLPAIRFRRQVQLNKNRLRLRPSLRPQSLQQPNPACWTSSDPCCRGQRSNGSAHRWMRTTRRERSNRGHAGAAWCTLVGELESVYLEGTLS